MRGFATTVGCCILAVGLCQGAASADLVPTKAAPAPIAASIWEWTGFYVGGHFGAGWARDQWSAPGLFSDSATNLHDAGIDTALGPLGGFQVGYNWQFPNLPMVIGVEGEFSFADLKGDHGQSGSASAVSNDVECSGFCNYQTVVNANAEERLSTKVKDIATIAARLGITSGPDNRTLWYIKGGAVWAKSNFATDLHTSATACTNLFIAGVFGEPLGCQAFDATGSGSGYNSHWGWTVGTGVEFGLVDNWSAKIEYDFLDLGHHNIALNVTGSSAEGAFNLARDFSINQQIHTVKVGLNYRFSGFGH
jgi:outer membrane immunogenic protein